MPHIELDKTDAGLSRSAAPGDAITVELDEIPTSGYRWELDAYDPSVLEPDGDDFSPATDGTLGGGGTRRFRLKVVGSGTSQLKFVRRRAWEPGVVVQAFETTIEATS